jgi:hypothetical protein
MRKISSLCDDGTIDFNKSTFLKTLDCLDISDKFWLTVSKVRNMRLFLINLYKSILTAIPI